MGIEWTKTLESFSGIEQAAREGFKSIQLEVGTLAALSESELQQHKRHLQQDGLGVAVCTSPLPDSVSVTQKGFNIYVWIEYLKKAVGFVSEVGCRKIAWNNGRSRLLPLEGDTSDAKQQTLQFLAMLCETSASQGITVLVEPLDPRRTNFLNTMEETEELISMVGRKNLSSMISLREMEAIGLNDFELERFSGLINHVQLENPHADGGKREAPRPTDGYDYRPFLQSLRRIGYDGAIALPKDADADGLSYCVSLWEAAE